MNNPTQTLTDSAAKIVRRTCPKCNNVRETSEVICPVCGETLQSVARIKATGIFLVVGSALFRFMVWLAV